MSEHQLFIIKGVVAVVGLILLLWHMSTDDEQMTLARRLRYIALAAAAGFSAFASVEQVTEVAEWEERHWGALTTNLLILLAAIASLWEDRSTTLSETKGNQ